MAEATLFLLVVLALMVGVFSLFGIQSFDPKIVFMAVALLLIPGFYAAFGSGPFVPTVRKRVKAMFTLANLNADDVVYDLGFGDGRFIFPSAKIAKKAIGYELSIPLYLFGLVKKFVLRSKVIVRYGNIWKQDYTDATVIFCYLLPKAMVRFYAEIWPTLKPGTRVISNAFPLHAIKPEKELEKAYLYVKE